MLIGRRKIILGIIGTTLLGAFGSGLWEVIVKPFGLWLAQVILTIVTFGSSAVKDHIYREAAKGLHEAAAANVLLFATAFLISAPIALLITTFRLRKILNVKDTKQYNKNESRIYILLGIIFIMTGFITVDSLMTLEANRASIFFSQSLAICRPYMDEKQAFILSSQFAAIRNRKDFINVKNELQQIADSKKIILPDYKPW